MDIYFHEIGGKRFFSDRATNLPASGYTFWYGINDLIIKQDTPLENYEWPANTPLGIWKAQAKVGLDTLAKWQPGGGWYDENAGRQFDHNESFPTASFLFEPANSGYDTNKQFAHWMDVLPDMKLPKGQVWIMPVGKISTPAELIRKGVTHFSKYEMVNRPENKRIQSLGLVYDEVPRTPEQFGLKDRGEGASKWVPQGAGWPNIWNERYFGPLRPGQTEPLTYKEGFAAGKKFQVEWPIVVFENSEQDHALSAKWDCYRGFYDAYIPRLTAAWASKGVKPLVAHNYFTTFGEEGLTLGTGSRDRNKNILRDVASWPSSEMLKGGTLEKTTAVCFGLYLGAPDKTDVEAYKLIYASKVAQLGGKELLVFAQSFHEFRPNNLLEVRLKDGKLYFSAKQQYNPAQGINYSFLAQTFARGFIPFSAGGKTDGNFRYDRAWHKDEVYWLPNGAKKFADRDSFPYWGTPECFAGGQFEYYVAKGVQFYCDTFAKTKGGKSAFLKYRLDGGEWVVPANRDLDDLVDAYHDRTGFVYSEEQDGLLAVFYLNSFADSKLHTLEYEHKGKLYTMKVHSTVVHPVLHKL